MKPQPPLFSHAPRKVAADTWLVQHFQGEGTGQTILPIHSAVIAGAEPVLVDTGAVSNRAQWLDDVFGLVDPCDVRWIFVSHDDADHIGNLEPVLDLCPRATLVTSWLQLTRLATSLAVPLSRCRVVDDGESFDAGDRRLLAVRPPVFDSPTTRGLLDTATGVYWAADAWGTTVPEPVAAVGDLDPQGWRDGVTTYALWTAPWLELVDTPRWGRTVDRIADLRPAVIAAAHTPMIPGSHVAAAVALLRSVAGRRPEPFPGQGLEARTELVTPG